MGEHKRIITDLLNDGIDSVENIEHIGPMKHYNEMLDNYV